MNINKNPTLALPSPPLLADIQVEFVCTTNSVRNVLTTKLEMVQ